MWTQYFFSWCQVYIVKIEAFDHFDEPTAFPDANTTFLIWNSTKYKNCKTLLICKVAVEKKILTSAINQYLFCRIFLRTLFFQLRRKLFSKLGLNADLYLLHIIYDHHSYKLNIYEIRSYLIIKYIYIYKHKYSFGLLYLNKYLFAPLIRFID